MTRRVAFIPARGGSKRLPLKNIRPFMGKPIIAWSIEAAEKSGLFDAIVVSTDDQEIGRIAADYGAEVEQRRACLATDEASVANVCIDYLLAQSAKGINWLEMVVLYATAPLRRADDIKNTVNLLEDGVCNFALAATEYDLPPHQALKLTNECDATPMWPKLAPMKASDIGHLVVDNGSTYAVNVASFLNQKNFYGTDLRVNLMPRHRSSDIDEEIDFKIAEFFAKQEQN